jgi:tRNA(fMet)-specific endonuclease VapC
MAAECFMGVAVADATVRAAALVSDLRTQDIRIGTQDLRIAAMAVVHDTTLVTRNARDVAQTPGLVIEDWSAL